MLGLCGQVLGKSGSTVRSPHVAARVRRAPRREAGTSPPHLPECGLCRFPWRIDGPIWPYMAIYGHIWPYLALSGHMYGHVWPRIAICAHVRPLAGCFAASGQKNVKTGWKTNFPPSRVLRGVFGSYMAMYVWPFARLFSIRAASAAP